MGVLSIALALVAVIMLPAGAAEALVTGGTGQALDDGGAQDRSAYRYVEDGVYVMNVAEDSSLVVGVSGSGKKAGNKAVLKNDTGSKGQEWKVSWNEQEGAYRIKNVNSGLFLTAKGAGANKAAVTQQAYAEVENQLWTLERDGDRYRIASLADETLRFGSGNGKLKANEGIATVASKALRFYLLPVGKSQMMPSEKAVSDLDGMFAKMSLASKSGLNVGIKGNSTKSGALAKLAKKSDARSQIWYFRAVNKKEGLYVLVNVGSSMALRVEGSGRGVGTNVVQGKLDASKLTQQWWVRSAGKGTYTFTSRYNGLVLRAKGTKAGSGMNLKTGDENSAFKLHEVSMLSSGVYQISPQKNANLAFGVSGGSEKINKQLHASSAKEGLAYKFSVTKAKENQYAINIASSNRYIGEVKGKVVQGTRSTKASQLWKLDWRNGGLALRNAKTGRFLSVSGSVKNGAKLSAKSKYTAKSAQLVFSETRLLDDGLYFLAKASSNKKVAGISGDNCSVDGAPVGIFKRANALPLKFYVNYCGKDSSGNALYTILNDGTWMYLTANGNSVIQKKSKGKKSQRWAAVVSKSGGIAFKNAATGRYLSFGTKRMTTAKYKKKGSDSNMRFNPILTGTFTLPQRQAYDRVMSTFSNTNYAIVANLSDHRVYVWQRANKKAPWALKFDWICSSGSFVNGTATPEFNILSTGRKRFENPLYRPDGTLYGSSFWYMTYIGSGKYFHSPLYRKGSMTVYSDGRMGRFISHGCVRVHMDNAKWIYTHIKKGTRMIVHY